MPTVPIIWNRNKLSTRRWTKLVQKRSFWLFAAAAAVLLSFACAAMLCADAGNIAGDADHGGAETSAGTAGRTGDGEAGGRESEGPSFAELTGSDLPIGPAVGAVVIVVIFFAWMRGRRPRGRARVSPLVPPRGDLMPIEAYRRIDPNFDTERMCGELANIYIRLQSAWCARDLSPVRSSLSGELYAQLSSQLDAIRRQGRTPHVDRPAVLGVDIVGWSQSGVADSIVARLTARIVDYTTDDASGAVVSGSMTDEKFIQYEWTLSRASGMSSPSSTGGVVTIACPNCGAPVDINMSARCEYCGSEIERSAHELALCRIEAVSQRTGR